MHVGGEKVFSCCMSIMWKGKWQGDTIMNYTMRKEKTALANDKKK